MFQSYTILFSQTPRIEGDFYSRKEGSVTYKKRPIFVKKIFSTNVSGSSLRVVDVAKYLYTPELELTEQLKISTIKYCVPGKTDQMPYKIKKDKRKKGGESKR